MRYANRGAFLSLISAAAILAAGCASATSGPPNPQTLSANAGEGANSANSGPRTWELAAGGNRRNEALQGLDFFPNTITVDVGDSVTWTVGGNAHTITFLGPLKSFPNNDNPNSPFGGNSYDGSALTSSGLLIPTNQYTLRFTKAGVYPYMCLFHPPEMVGLIVVNPKGTPYPHSQGFYQGKGLAELNGQLAEAQAALRQFPYATNGTTLVAGIAPGLAAGAPSNSTVLRFLDADRLGRDDRSTTVTVAVGTTLTWVNQTNNEPHTVTFPPAGQPPPNIDPFTPPIGGNSYDGTSLVHSGPVFPGGSFSLTFTKRGTFEYFCLLHDFVGMVGKVVVR